VISSGRKRLWLDTASFGSKYGSVNTPWTPRRGNEVNVMGISFCFRCWRARFRLYYELANLNQPAFRRISLAPTCSACCLRLTADQKGIRYKGILVSIRACIGRTRGEKWARTLCMYHCYFTYQHSEGIDHSRLWATFTDAAHNGTKFSQYLCLPQRQFRVLLLLVK
jgi:hypothetical protein